MARPFKSSPTGYDTATSKHADLDNMQHIRQNDELHDMVTNTKKSVIAFGTDTPLKRCGLTLLGASLLFFVALCLYWNLANKSFFHEPYLVVEKGSDFPVRSTSLKQFDKFMSRNFFYILIVAGIFFGLTLFSGFAHALTVWIKTGKWPEKAIKEAKPFEMKTILKRLQKKAIALYALACLAFLAWMFYEDWYNAAAAFLETALQVGLFALVIWLGKMGWERIKTRFLPPRRD